MVQEVKQIIAAKLVSIHNNAKVYDEEVLQGFKEPSFFISTYEQNYEKRIGAKYTSNLVFDVAYFPDKKTSNNEIQDIGVELFREFDLVGGFRIINKKANITDGILHFMFEIKYSELKIENNIKMANLEQNINYKEG